MALTQRQRRSVTPRLRVGALVLIVAFAAPAVADAQSPTAGGGERSASAIFDEAKAAFAKKDYAAAARKFEEANQRSPRGQTRFNAGLSWEAAADPARAADAFAAAVEDPALPTAAREHAKERLGVLERSVLTLHVEAREPATATIAHVVDRAVPATVHVGPGRHELVVRFHEGGIVRQEIEARAAEHVTLKVSPPALADARPEPTPALSSAPDREGSPAAPALATSTTTPAVLEPRASMTRSIQPTLGWIALGVSAASLTAAIFLGLQGVAARDAFDDSGATDADARSRAITLRTSANVSWIAAGAFAATGALLLITVPPRATTGAGVSLGLGALSGSF